VDRPAEGIWTKKSNNWKNRSIMRALECDISFEAVLTNIIADVDGIATHASPDYVAMTLQVVTIMVFPYQV
jgi:hypothetical protein